MPDTPVDAPRDLSHPTTPFEPPAEPRDLAHPPPADREDRDDA